MRTRKNSSGCPDTRTEHSTFNPMPSSLSVPETVPLMRRALDLARQAWGQTHPNPMVGALIVEDGQIVAEGFHRKAGGPHAEIEALRALGRKPAPGASLVVTLEPCSTHGKTGACTTALLESGLKHVVVGARDPNPAHAGRGLELLRSAGVTVDEGVLAEECTDLNLVFNQHIATGRPFVAMKVALTLDGCLAASSGNSKWVTGPEARADVMRWRRLFPAIAVGSGTVERDDPALTSRLPGETWCPRRFVFNADLSLLASRPGAQVFTDAFASRTVLVAARPSVEKLERAESMGIEVWLCPSQAGSIDLWQWRARVALAGITGVFVEPGPTLFRSFSAAGMGDYLLAYTAPWLLGDTEALRPLTNLKPGSISEGLRLTSPRHSVLGEDVLTRGFLVHPVRAHAQTSPLP